MKKCIFWESWLRNSKNRPDNHWGSVPGSENQPTQPVQILPPFSALRNCSQDSFLQHACCARRCTFDHERRLHYKYDLPISHLLYAMSYSHKEKKSFWNYFFGVVVFAVDGPRL
jgi:hypothetical protein